MRISVYFSSADNLPKNFCFLAEKCYYSKAKTNVFVENSDFAEGLDRVLWTYSKKHYIPHAMSSDEMLDKQPILISYEAESYMKDASINMMVNMEEKSILDRLANDFTGNRLMFLAEAKKTNITMLDNVLSRSQYKDIEIEKFKQGPTGAWEKIN